MIGKIAAQEAQSWVKDAVARGLLTPEGLQTGAAAEMIFPDSIQKVKEDTLALIRLASGAALLVVGPNRAGFSGCRTSASAEVVICPGSSENAGVLRRVLPFTAPVPLADQAITFGVGDRLGVASPGHLRLFKRYRAAPILAQQSVRELDLTGRDYQDVLDAATWAVFQEGYTAPWGADGDHLKSEQWVQTALKIGYTMITADVSDSIKDYGADPLAEQIAKDYGQLEEAYRQRVEKAYLALSLKLDTGETIGFTREQLMQTVLIYRQAVDHALRLYQAGVEICGVGGFDFELSIDETTTPTTPQAHVFMALEARLAGVVVASMAPRFVGEFQKGIDYIGDVQKFRESFEIHAAIAREYGYRISVHSGSDKFAVFPSIGELTRATFHIKTAGTNWLEAVRVVSQVDPVFFKELYAYALQVFEKARAYYHITPNMDNVPAAEGLTTADLAGLFVNPDTRQVIHITYGEIMHNTDLKTRFYRILNDHIEDYWQALEQHIGRHLELLGCPA